MFIMFIHKWLLAHVYYIYPHKVIGTCLLHLSTYGYWHMFIIFIHIRSLAHVYYAYPHNVIGICLLCLSTQSYKYISINILQTSQSDMFNEGQFRVQKIIPMCLLTLQTLFSCANHKVFIGIFGQSLLKVRFLFNLGKNFKK